MKQGAPQVEASRTEGHPSSPSRRERVVSLVASVLPILALIGLLCRPAKRPTLEKRIDSLRSRWPEKRKQVRAELLAAGKEATRPLAACLEHESNHLRLEAAKLLTKLAAAGAIGREVQPTVTGALCRTLHLEWTHDAGLKRRFRTSHRELELAIIEALAHLPSEGSVAILTEALCRQDPVVAHAASLALARQGRLATKPLEQLVQTEAPHTVRGLARLEAERLIRSFARSISEHDSGRGVAAARDLGRMPISAAAAALTVALRSPEPQVRLAAARELADLARRLYLGETTVDALIGALSDPDRLVRYPAALALSRQGHEVAFLALLRALKEADPKIRVVACHGLGEVGHAKAMIALCRHTLDPDVEVRTAAISALAAMGDYRATITINQLLPEYQQEQMRHLEIDLLFAELLARLHQTEIDERVRRPEKVAAARTSRGVNYLAQIVRSEHGERRRHALRVLAKLARYKFLAKEATAELAREGTVAIQTGKGDYGDAFETLGTLESPQAVDVFLEVLESKGPKTARAAVQWLGRLRCNRAKDALHRAAKDGAPPPAADALLALLQIGDKSVVRGISELLPGTSVQFQMAVAEALGGAGSQDAHGLLTEMLDAPAIEVRDAAARSLARRRQEGSEEALRSILPELSPPAYGDVCRELCFMGDAEVIRILSGAANSRDDPRRDIALALLAEVARPSLARATLDRLRQGP